MTMHLSGDATEPLPYPDYLTINSLFMKHGTAYNHIYLQGRKSYIRYWTYGIFIVFVILLFLSWTQTIRSRGAVISLRQVQCPQQINTIIPVRILKCHIKEVYFISACDTLAQLAVT